MDKIGKNYKLKKKLKSKFVIYLYYSYVIASRELKR